MRPRSSQDFLGQGFTFPLRPNTAGRLTYRRDEEKVRQSIWLILSTAPGERVMRPNFGCGLQDLVFEANTSALRGRVQQKVRDALLRFEPRINVLGVQVESDPTARNRLEIRIDYRILELNAYQNLVYPFFLNEGAR